MSENVQENYTRGHRYKDRTGEKFGELTLIKYIGDRKWRCKCSCGNETTVSIYNLLNGKTISCGHVQRQLASERCKTLKQAEDLSNQVIGFRRVLNYKGTGRWECECTICGYTEIIEKRYIRSRRCVHKLNNFNNLKDKQINDWTIIKYVGNKSWLCRCVCGIEKVIKTQRLITGDSKSCGCRRSRNMLKSFNVPEESADMLLDKESLINKLLEMKNRNFKRPDLLQIANELNVNYQMIIRYINKYSLSEYVEYKSGTSYKEDEVYEYISSIYTGNIVRRFKYDRDNFEIDIYLPDKGVGIEFNGSYWHSSEFKESDYHINKTLYFAKNGIRIIHIFEYEWDDPIKQEKLKRLLNNVINGSVNVYARDTKVIVLENEEYNEFCNKYHLQNSANASVKLGLKLKETVVGIMSFGNPRFSNDTEYELIRECWGDNIVVGGPEKLFKHFIRKYKPNSIVSYCDISKFTGSSYLRLGFLLEEPKITKPNYVWVHNYNGDIFSRYQTQKSKLVLNKLGSESETEDEIMSRHGFLKVYDCGNFRFVWRNSNGN